MRIVERDDDFCPRSLGPNPVLLAIHRCPGCGYCASTAEFAPMQDERRREKLQRALRHMAQTQIHTIRERYERRARLGLELGEPSQVIADSYLKAAWAARITGEPAAHEAACLRKAVQYFELALQARSVSSGRRPVLVYLLAALNRRLERPEKARRWLAHLDTLQRDTWPRWLPSWQACLHSRLR